MILRRLGNKKKIAREIQQHFPRHKIYAEPFFGAGGMYFQKPKAQYNFLNDLDSDVANLFWCVIDRKEELRDAFMAMPLHLNLWNHWKNFEESDPIKKAIRFLFLSNYGFLGKANTMRFGTDNYKQYFEQFLERTHQLIFDAVFSNVDFRRFFEQISGIRDADIPRTLVYCDPPYLDTSNNYSDGFTKQDTTDLIRILVDSGYMFAMSEFDHPFILDIAQAYRLNVITIGARRNINNRRTEILLTNYTSQIQLFDFA